MANFDDILKAISSAVDDFQKTIPANQKDMLAQVEAEVKKLDTTSTGVIKASVSNLKLIAKIKADLKNLVLTDKYLQSVTDFVDTYNTISTLQNEYWASIVTEFKPNQVLKEIRVQAIADTVNSLTEQGIGPTISEDIAGILQTNITSGGSYRDLTDQLRTALTDSEGNPGLLSKYAKQITVDAVNQYSAQYMQAVTAKFSFEWFAYTGADIVTSRPFCLAVTEFTYFHVSEIPALLAARGLYYTTVKTKERLAVPIYDKTGLPQGMYEGTNPANFRTLRGGYWCGHQVRPVFESQVPQAIKDRVKNNLPFNSK